MAIVSELIGSGQMADGGDWSLTVNYNDSGQRLIDTIVYDGTQTTWGLHVEVDATANGVVLGEHDFVAGPTPDVYTPTVNMRWPIRRNKPSGAIEIRYWGNPPG